MDDLRQRLLISPEHVGEINAMILDPKCEVVNAFLDIVRKHGGPEAINRKADEARQLPRLLERLRASGSPYLADVDWLARERDRGAFVTIAEFRRRVLGDRAKTTRFDERHPVTLEISALQYFPWLIAEARQAIAKHEVMPGRYIRVRNMAEQVQDQGDTLAVAAAMQIVGASSKRWTPRARTARTSISAAWRPSPGTSAASASRTSTRWPGWTNSSPTTPSTGSAKS
jgi:hypothetical protein